MRRFRTMTATAMLALTLAAAAQDDRPDAELIEMLRVAAMIGEELGLRVQKTFLGAHALPPEYKGRSDDYIALVCDEMLPRAHAEGLVDAVDVFIESIAFSVDQGERVLECAQRLGLPVKAHVEQLSDLGGAVMAARRGALVDPVMQRDGTREGDDRKKTARLDVDAASGCP